jgi:nucleoside-diphosphate-sugar epimerase
MVMEKVLVTGASGFLGQAIVKKLSNEKKWEIYALASGRHPVDFLSGIKKAYCDLLNPLEQKNIIDSIKPEIILHLAWDLSHEYFLESVNNIAWLEASLHLLRLFRESGGKYFLFAGSSAEYSKEHNTTTGVVSSSGSLYGRCKLAFTNIALSIMGGGGGGVIHPEKTPKNWGKII